MLKVVIFKNKLPEIIIMLKTNDLESPNQAQKHFLVTEVSLCGNQPLDKKNHTDYIF